MSLKLAIVGCGNHSHVHAAAVRDVAGVELIACADVDAERAEAWAARYECRAWHPSLAALLEQTALDAVILCTWPSQHAEQIRACLAAGIRGILCEKALVVSAEEARATWDLVRRHEALLMEGSMYRHHPAILKLERILSNGDLGPVDSVRAAFHNCEPEATAPPDWRYRRECGGGVLHDWMHYLVDACNHFCGGSPVRAFAVGNVAEKSGVVHRIYGMVEYANGRVGSIESSKTASFSESLQITCAHGTLELPIAWGIHGEVTLTQTRRKPPWPYVLRDTYEIEEANAFVLQLDDFRRAVCGETPPRVPLRESIVNAYTTEALATSLRERRAVDVDLPDLDSPA